FMGASVAALGLAQPVFAQSGDGAAADDSVAIEEVVVTAQKRTENLKDVPMSIQVVSGDALQENNLTKFQDLALMTPGLELNVVGNRQQVIQLRGVAFNPDSNSAATVQVYLNDAAIPA